MARAFQALVRDRGEVTYVKLSGVIDEESELGVLLDKIRGRVVVLELGEIERINTFGVRDWLNWIGKLDQAGFEVVLVECSPAVVAQINLVDNFIGKGGVKSFYVPYFCSACDREAALLCETEAMGPPPHEPPTFRCDQCDLVMAFDDMQEGYFNFLLDRGKVTGGSPASASAAEQFEIELSMSGTGAESNRTSSLPSIPSLPNLTPSLRGGARIEKAAAEEEQTAPAAEGAREEEREEEIALASTLRTSGVGPRPAGGVSRAMIAIFLLVLALGGLAYFLFSEP